MGRGKTFDYKKILKDIEEICFRERHLITERITAVYGGGPSSTGEWTPAVDVYETKDAFVLVAEVAGLEQDDIRLDVAGNILHLRGHRPFGRKGISSENYYRMEFAYGSFDRVFTLPAAVREEEVLAVLKNGVLTVTLPRSDAGGGREIEVNES